MGTDRLNATRLRPRSTNGTLLARTSEQFAEAFWARVACGRADQCWLWTGPLHYKGYGEIAKSRAVPERKSHRVAYHLSKGPIPRGMVVMHSCDCPPCCNPNHLGIGTARENVLDSVRKGRRAKPWTTKLTVDEVLEIRAIGESQSRTQIGKKFGITGRNVLSILRRDSWRNV